MSVLSAEQSARFVDLLTLVPVLALVMWIAQIASLAIGKSVSITSEHEKSAEKSADFFFCVARFSFFHNEREISEKLSKMFLGCAILKVS